MKLKKNFKTLLNSKKKKQLTKHSFFEFLKSYEIEVYPYDVPLFIVKKC